MTRRLVGGFLLKFKHLYGSIWATRGRKGEKRPLKITKENAKAHRSARPKDEVADYETPRVGDFLRFPLEVPGRGAERGASREHDLSGKGSRRGCVTCLLVPLGYTARQVVIMFARDFDLYTYLGGWG